MITFIEWVAAVAGLIGTWLLATKSPNAGWGFVAYLVSNAGWITFALAKGHYGLLLQQVGFTITSCVGVYVWLWKDRK